MRGRSPRLCITRAPHRSRFEFSQSYGDPPSEQHAGSVERQASLEPVSASAIFTLAPPRLLHYGREMTVVANLQPLIPGRDGAPRSRAVFDRQDRARNGLPGTKFGNRAFEPDAI